MVISRKSKINKKRRVRESTPSTVACTDSEGEISLMPCKNWKRGQKRATVESESDSDYSVLNASERLSTQCVELEKQRVTEEACAASDSCNKFRERLCQILQRVEDLNLPSISQSVPEMAKKSKKAKKKARKDFSSGEELGTASELSEEELLDDPLPRIARLSREELNALCIETGQMRVVSSLSSLPTGWLVRFLTLMLIRMRDVLRLPPKFPSQISDEKKLELDELRSAKTPGDIKIEGLGETFHLFPVRTVELSMSRQLASLMQRSGQSPAPDSGFLWSQPYFVRVLSGVECALICLNVIANPDIPRNVLLDELIEAVTGMAMRLLVNVLFVAPAQTFAFDKAITNANSPQLSAQAHLVLCLGRRVSQIVAGLASLVRLQPCKLTDSLVIQLSQLALAMPTHVLANPAGGVNQSLRQQLDNGFAFIFILYLF
ncbi:Sister chromatid cohesion protein 2 [Cichlidogyrus casuarinus]|uniref:Sister chromatid cohesion protein 2 n=1 Tax=Cichlidogyrus casuarinus TaxID=1844966 RepID=A0ABD2QHW0_9PLAT